MFYLIVHVYALSETESGKGKIKPFTSNSHHHHHNEAEVIMVHHLTHSLLSRIKSGLFHEFSFLTKTSRHSFVLPSVVLRQQNHDQIYLISLIIVKVFFFYFHALKVFFVCISLHCIHSMYSRNHILASCFQTYLLIVKVSHAHTTIQN